MTNKQRITHSAKVLSDSLSAHPLLTLATALIPLIVAADARYAKAAEVQQVRTIDSLKGEFRMQRIMAALSRQDTVLQELKISVDLLHTRIK